MKLAKFAFMVACCCTVVSVPYTYAADTTVEELSYAQAESYIAQTETELTKVISGLSNYYTTNLGFPSSLGLISSYYSGDFSTPIGTIKGGVSSSSYTLYIDLTMTDSQIIAMTKSLASTMGGAYSTSSNRLTIPVDPPQNAAIVSSMLSRFEDKTGSGLNTMHTNIDMNSFSINNADQLNSDSVNTNSVKTTTINATTGNIDKVISKSIVSDKVSTPLIDSSTGIINLTANLVVGGNEEVTGNATFDGNITQDSSKTATFGNLVAAGTATFNDSISQVAGKTASFGILSAESATITDNLTVGGYGVFIGGLQTSSGTQIIDNNGILYYKGEDTDTRYINAEETAYDSDRLGGYDADLYARTNAENTFTATQNFASTTTSGNSEISGQLYVDGNSYQYDIYLKKSGIWLSDLNTKVNNLTNQVNDLSSKLSSAVDGISKGSWAFTGTSVQRDLGNSSMSGSCIKGQTAKLLSHTYQYYTGSKSQSYHLDKTFYNYTCR